MAAANLFTADAPRREVVWHEAPDRAVLARRTDWHSREYAGCGHVPPLEVADRFTDDLVTFVRDLPL